MNMLHRVYLNECSFNTLCILGKRCMTSHYYLWVHMVWGGFTFARRFCTIPVCMVSAWGLLKLGKAHPHICFSQEAGTKCHSGLKWSRHNEMQSLKLFCRKWYTGAWLLLMTGSKSAPILSRGSQMALLYWWCISIFVVHGFYQQKSHRRLAFEKITGVIIPHGGADL